MAINVTIATAFNAQGLREADKAFGALKGNLASAGKVIAGVGVALTGLAVAGIGLAKVGEEAATSNARITKIAESMGLFGDQVGVVSARLQDLAKKTALATGVDIDSIKATQAKLLTFKELAKSADVVGGEFDRATKAAIDLAAAGFGSAESNATALGKALQNPIKGITALSRSGVTFTEQEKSKIATLVESNKTFEAQKLILDAIEKQVGGVSEATANASDKINQAFKIFGQELGVLLLPVFEKITGAISDKLLPKLEKILPAVVAKITEALDKVDFDKLAEDIGNSIGWLVENGETILRVAGYIATFVAVLWTVDTAIKAVAAAQALWNLVLKANPIGLIVIGIAALITVIILVVNHLAELSGGWDKVFKNIGKIVDNFVAGFKSAMSQIGSFFGSIFSSLASMARGALNGVIGLIEGYLNHLIGGVNILLGLINKVLDAGKVVGLNLQIPTLEKLNIPRLADGGIVMPRTGGVLANIAEGGQAEAVIPLNRLNNFGQKPQNVYNINVDGGVGSGATIGQAVVEAIKAYERTSGPVWQGA
jgi:hypothetical protein